MGIFFTSHEAVLPTINTALKEALLVEPATVADIDKDTSAQNDESLQIDFTDVQRMAFLGAAAIAGVLLGVAIWTGQHNLADISKDLMNSFSGFIGVVLGLLGGEAQKST